MQNSLKKGLGFGLVSGIITTLGLMVGLHSGTNSRIVVVTGILLIAMTDAFSDALGIHISEECENQHTNKEVWCATIATFCSKFIFALTFVIPVLLFSLGIAIIVSIFWGLFLIAVFSFHIAKQQGVKPHKVVFEHVGLTILVVIATHYIGEIIKFFMA